MNTVDICEDFMLHLITDLVHSLHDEHEGKKALSLGVDLYHLSVPTPIQLKVTMSRLELRTQPFCWNYPACLKSPVRQCLIVCLAFILAFLLLVSGSVEVLRSLFKSAPCYIPVTRWWTDDQNPRGRIRACSVMGHGSGPAGVGQESDTGPSQLRRHLHKPEKSLCALCLMCPISIDLQHT